MIGNNKTILNYNIFQFKGPWTSEEDEKLLFWVQQYGPFKWSQCSELITGRSGKQCRERWFNNLNPNVKKGNWTQDEDNAIFKGYLAHGSSWSRIAKNLEGRTENSVKNRFYSTVRKLLSDMEKKGKFINQDNESDIKTIIQMTLQEYQQNSCKAKDIEHDQDQDDQQIRKQSTSVSNGISVIQDNQDQNLKYNKNVNDEDEDDHNHMNEKQQETVTNRLNKDSLLLNKLDEKKNEIIQEDNIGLVQNDHLDDNPQRNRFLSINSNQSCSYALGLQDQIEKHDETLINLDNIDEQSKNPQNHDENQQQMISQLDNQSVNENNNEQQQQLQQNQILQKNNLSQQQQSTLKLKDEYSQQNCLYRLILEGNVSIKKTISMRDYSLYQKNKAKSRSKKYQRLQQDDQQKCDESSPFSMKGDEQFHNQSNSQFQYNSIKEGQLQGNSNNEIQSKGQKLLMQVKQPKLDDSQQNQNIYNNHDSIQQKINCGINSKIIQNKMNTPQSQKKGNSINIACNTKNSKQENINNLNSLLKEKLISLNNMNNQKNKKLDQDNDNDDQDESNSISRSSSMSDDEEDIQKKKSMKMKQLSSLQKAQQLQKEIEEKKKQLLMLNLESKIEKKKQKLNTLNSNEKINKIYSDNSEKLTMKNMLEKSKIQPIQLKEEYEEDYYNDQYDNKINKKKSSIIDHEQQKKIIQRMLKNHNEQKTKKQINNDDLSSSNNDSEVENNNNKSKKKLKLLKKLQAFKKQQKYNYQNDSDNKDSDINNSENEDEQSYNNQSEEEGQGDNNINEEEEEDEEQEEQKQSENVSNKLMKYLSTSFAKIVQSITKKVNKKYKKDQNKSQLKLESNNKQLFQKYMLLKQNKYQDNFNKSNYNKQIEEEDEYVQNSNKIKNKKKQQINNNYNLQFNDQDIKKKIKKEENSNENLSQIDQINENITQANENIRQEQYQLQSSQKNNSKDLHNQQKNSSNQQESLINSGLRQQLNFKDSNIDSSNAAKSDILFKDCKQDTFNDKTPRNKSESIQSNKNIKQQEQLQTRKSIQIPELEISKQQSSNQSMKTDEEKKGKKKNIQDKGVKKNLEQINKKKIIFPNILSKQQSNNESKLQILSDQQDEKPQQMEEDQNNQQMKTSQSQYNLPKQIALNKHSSSQQSGYFDQNNTTIAHTMYSSKSISSEYILAGVNPPYNTKLGTNPNIETAIGNTKIYSDQNKIKHQTQSPQEQINQNGNNPLFNYKDNLANKSQISLQTIIDQLPKDGKDGDDRIDYLISQLQSLESLLNTTKQELNKLESTIHVPSQPSLAHQQTSILSSSEDLIQILDDHNMYHKQSNHLNIQTNYNNSIGQYPVRKLSQHSEISQRSNQINAQNQHLNQLFQNSFDCSSDNNLSQNVRGGKMNHQNNLNDIISMDFGFYNKYNDEVLSIGQEQEKEIFNLDNLSESQCKDQTYQQKNVNQQVNSHLNNQNKDDKQQNNSIMEEEKNNMTDYNNEQNIFMNRKQNEDKEEKQDKNNKNKDQKHSIQSNDSQQNQQEIHSDDMLRIDNNNLQVSSSCNLKYGKSKNQEKFQNQTYVKQFIMNNGDSGSYLNDENNSQIQLSLCDD